MPPITRETIDSMERLATQSEPEMSDNRRSELRMVTDSWRAALDLEHRREMDERTFERIKPFITCLKTRC